MPTAPDGEQHGASRGKHIDRRYIEEFVAENREAIRGRCLEIREAQYIEQFGGPDVKSVDILDINPANDRATVIGDLQNLSLVKDGTYDCVIATQVMQYLQDPSYGARELHRVLAPGGTALVSCPTMSPVNLDNWPDRWRFMPAGVRDLFAAHFGPDNVEVKSYGNLLTGLGFWAGLAQQDLPRKAWTFDDASYPVIVTVRATRTRA